MKKLLIFHTALAPYRIDQFNALGNYFDVEIVFLFDNVRNQKFNQKILLSQLKCKYSFLLHGFSKNERVFRFGILKSIRRFKPDLIISYEFSFTTQYLILLKRLGLIQQKIGSMVDDSLEICNKVQTRTRLIAREISIKKMDYLIVLSNEVAHFYQNKYGINDDQILISPILEFPDRLRSCCVEIENISNRYIEQYQLEGRKTLLFVGRLVAVKGLVEFITNISIHLQMLDKVVIVLVGDGDERAKIESLLKQKQLSEKIILTGRLEESELYGWYLCASGFVLPSTYEPFGAVVNESLIFGTKVLCSKYAGSSNLINSENGLIFDPKDLKQTIEKFNQFLEMIEVTRNNVELNKKPSLMIDNKIDYSEWKVLS